MDFTLNFLPNNQTNTNDYRTSAEQEFDGSQLRTTILSLVYVQIKQEALFSLYTTLKTGRNPKPRAGPGQKTGKTVSSSLFTLL